MTPKYVIWAHWLDGSSAKFLALEGPDPAAAIGGMLTFEAVDEEEVSGIFIPIRNLRRWSMRRLEEPRPPGREETT